MATSTATAKMDEFHLALGSLDHVQICGNTVALVGQGIQIGDALEVDRTFEDRTTIPGNDGHQWETWGAGFFRFARRARTPAERVRYIDHRNSCVSTGHFSKDRQDMTFAIANALSTLALNMTPDKVMPRERRRCLKKRLAVLSNVLFQLSAWPTLDMAEARKTLAEVGVFVEQEEYFH